MDTYTFKELSANAFQEIPSRPGVYFVCVSRGFKQEFIDPGTGGHFRGRNPNVRPKTLDNKWVDGAEKIYIGRSTDLKHRIRLFHNFGNGGAVAKWGGRYIWQIKNAMNELSVSWDEDPNPKKRERMEIEKFKDEHKGKLPFANLVTPRRK